MTKTQAAGLAAVLIAAGSGAWARSPEASKAAPFQLESQVATLNAEQQSLLEASAAARMERSRARARASQGAREASSANKRLMAIVSRKSVGTQELFDLQDAFAERADANYHDPDSGATPLMLAAFLGHSDVVKYLLWRGADINAQDHAGFTALMYAAATGYKGTVKYLLKRGADLAVIARDGRTPLMIAAQHGQMGVYKLLLDAGADPAVRDYNNLSAPNYVELYRQKQGPR